MAYLFGVSGTTRINCGSTPGKANTFSLAIRLRPTQAINNVYRTPVEYGTTNDIQVTTFFSGAGGGTANNNFNMGFFASGPSFKVVTWDSGFTAGSLHTVVGTYDQINLTLYADTDASPKAQQPVTEAPLQGGGQVFMIGNDHAGTSQDADSTIYEVAWWPGVVLSGAQAAQFGAGFDARFITPRPSHHWHLIANAQDTIGNAHGTVTGATLVAHDARIYRPAPRLRAGTPAVASTRRRLTLLGVS